MLDPAAGRAAADAAQPRGARASAVGASPQGPPVAGRWRRVRRPRTMGCDEKSARGLARRRPLAAGAGRRCWRRSSSRSASAKRSAGRSWSGPIQRQLAKTLDRRSSSAPSRRARPGVRIGLLGSVRVQRRVARDRRAGLEHGAAHAAGPRRRLKLGYLDLWRAWHGGRCTSPRSRRRRSTRVLERRADGRASWQFGPKKDHRRRARSRGALPTFGTACASATATWSTTTRSCRPASTRASRSATAAGRRRHAHLAGRRAPPRAAASGAVAPAASDAGIVIRAGGAAARRLGPGRAREPRAEGESGLRLKATGQYRKLPVRIDLRTAGVLGFLAEGARGRGAAPVAARLDRPGRPELRRQHAPTRSHFAGAEGPLQPGRAVAGRGRRSARHHPADDAAVQDRTASSPRTAGLWKAVFDVGHASARAVSTAPSPTTRGARCRCSSGRLGGSRLVLADLGPAVGTPAQGSGAKETTGRSGARHPRQEVRPAVAAGDGRQRARRHRHVRPRHRRHRAAAAGAASTSCSPTACSRSPTSRA